MPSPDYRFFVYILASRSRQLYIGMTNNLLGRITQHRKSRPGTYTARYRIHRLVHFEETRYVLNAISRETDLKSWSRARKIALIESSNPTWIDLAEPWLGPLE